MNIFNSLGSNYDTSFVWRSVFQPGSRRATKRLKATLGEQYQGDVILTYKGRQALELALTASGLPKNSAVGINGFTCFEVYQSVKRAGYKPVIIDVAERSLHFGASELQAAHKRQPKPQAIIVQNTLGLPADMPALEAFCQKHDIMIIEDLAHSLGSTYADGREAGTVGSFTMLSFSQDKPLDVVAGGALIDRRTKKTPIDQPKKRVSLWQREKNSMYPLWTAIIRTTYPIGLGRGIHFGLKKLRLMATPMGDNLQGMYVMEPSAAKLLLQRWQVRAGELQHRLDIAKIYKQQLTTSIQFKPEVRSKPSYLRFPIWVDNRETLIARLKSKGVHIGDIWYDAPIGPRKYMERTDYTTGDCPHADDLAQHIVNLPTHRHVSERDARTIAEEVNAWLKS
jgi:dTDP-4-amino-4,6-dideoxygalactose transaminase